MKQILFITSLLLISISSYGQNFEVPDSILTNLELREFEYTYTAKFNYKIVYPDKFDASKEYPVLLGLSGGNASEKIVNYCYYTLFKSDYLKDYITILPIGPSGKTLADLDSTEINLLISDIKGKGNTSSNNWILAGTSMGGLAAFNFALARPELFEGIITFPGGLKIEDVPEEWNNYKVLLAVGENDDENWKNIIETSKNKLIGKVKRVDTFIIEGQEHIISPDYNIDKVYEVYFK